MILASLGSDRRVRRRGSTGAGLILAPVVMSLQAVDRRHGVRNFRGEILATLRKIIPGTGKQAAVRGEFHGRAE